MQYKNTNLHNSPSPPYEYVMESMQPVLWVTAICTDAVLSYQIKGDYFLCRLPLIALAQMYQYETSTPHA